MKKNKTVNNQGFWFVVLLGIALCGFGIWLLITGTIDFKDMVYSARCEIINSEYDDSEWEFPFCFVWTKMSTSQGWITIRIELQNHNQNYDWNRQNCLNLNHQNRTSPFNDSIVCWTTARMPKQEPNRIGAYQSKTVLETVKKQDSISKLSVGAIFFLTASVFLCIFLLVSPSCKCDPVFYYFSGSYCCKLKKPNVSEEEDTYQYHVVQ
jgi:hypothetical protein